MAFDFRSFPVLVNVLILVAAGGAIWYLGVRIAGLADQIADRTGLGKAFVGLVFLALSTETPEIATTVTASYFGNAPLAVGNLYGGITTQTAMLVVADILMRGKSLSYFTPKPVLALQAQLLIILLGLSVGLMLIGERVMIFHVGLWSVLLLLAYIAALLISKRYEASGQKWKPVDVPEQAAEPPAKEAEQHNPGGGPSSALFLSFAGVSLLILVAGFTVARAGEALADQTGLGSSFVGATLIALTTSLPELSTVVAAVRLGNPEMAFSNIFGSNMIMIALLFLSDVFYREGAILNDPEPSTLFAAVTGMVATTVYLLGMTERRDKTVLGMGLDSLAVLCLYGLSTLGLYLLRG